MNVNRRQLLTSAIAMASGASRAAGGGSSNAPDFSAVREDFPRVKTGKSPTLTTPPAIR